MTFLLWLARKHVAFCHWCYMRAGYAQDRAYDRLTDLEARR